MNKKRKPYAEKAPTRGAKPGERRGGRAPGVPNKLTKEFRESVNDLLRKNADKFSLWLDRVAAEDPKGALQIVCSIAEYAAPKLARTEHVGDPDNPVHSVTKIELVAMSGNGSQPD